MAVPSFGGIPSASAASQHSLPTLKSVKTPRVANGTAAVPRSSRIETCFAILSPSNTAGTLANIMPKALPSGHRGDRRLVPHLGQEEGQDAGAAYARALPATCNAIVDLVRNQYPAPHHQERQTDDPAKDVRPEHLSTCRSVVCQSGDNDAGDDVGGSAQGGGRHDGQPLRLVARLAKRGDIGRYGECFQERFPKAGGTKDHTASRPCPEAVWSLVLPGVDAARAVVVRTNCVDAGPCVAQGRYSTRVRLPQRIAPRGTCSALPQRPLPARELAGHEADGHRRDRVDSRRKTHKGRFDRMHLPPYI